MTKRTIYSYCSKIFEIGEIWIAGIIQSWTWYYNFLPLDGNLVQIICNFLHSTFSNAYIGVYEIEKTFLCFQIVFSKLYHAISKWHLLQHTTGNCMCAFSLYRAKGSYKYSLALISLMYHTCKWTKCVAGEADAVVLRADGECCELSLETKLTSHKDARSSLLSLI